jgi:hypothetical protein
MFALFEHTLKTSKGQAILRRNMETYDARKVYTDLKEVMMGSAKGDSSRKKLLHFIVTARYGKNVTRCSAEHFVILFREKFRQLDHLHYKTSSGFDNETRIMLLQNAVSGIDELDRVRTDKRLMNKVDMTFEEYADILELAAMDYDETFRENRINRTAYFLDRGAQDDPDLKIPDEYQDKDVFEYPQLEIFNTQQKKPPPVARKPGGPP